MYNWSSFSEGGSLFQVLLIFLKLSDSNFQFKGAIKKRSSSNSKNESLDYTQDTFQNIKSTYVCLLRCFFHTFCPPQMMDQNSPGLVGPSRLISLHLPDLPDLPDSAPKQSQDFGPGSEHRFESRWVADGFVFFPSVKTTGDSDSQLEQSKQRGEFRFVGLLRENESRRDPSFILKTKNGRKNLRQTYQNTNGTTLIDTKPR